MSDLPDFKKIEFPSTPPIPLEEIVSDGPPEVNLCGVVCAYLRLVLHCILQAVDLLKQMLVYNSKHRISASKASQCHTELSF